MMKPNIYFTLILFCLLFSSSWAYNPSGGGSDGRKVEPPEVSSGPSRVGRAPTGGTGSGQGPSWGYSWGWGSSPGSGWGYGSGSGRSPNGFGRGFGYGFGSGSGSGSGYGYGTGSGGAHGGGYGSGSGSGSGLEEVLVVVAVQEAVGQVDMETVCHRSLRKGTSMVRKTDLQFVFVCALEVIYDAATI
ncbi:glycine-rich protein [Actinidia rufa]|uniref:Glycine-rich protein n=1 Tax=Actinidia rufa TaxID=165716 RepID=A0A7J0EAQ9_9ERIC|nr:glycine-rich protein [Actinidia rufa]